MTMTSRLVASPCCNPDMSLKKTLAAYSALGFRKYELFTSWAQAAVDVTADPQSCLALGRRYGMAFASLHLPPINEDSPEAIAAAVRATRFAAALGVGIVLFKAKDRPLYIRTASRYLDAIAAAALPVTPVLQNHWHSPIATLDDFREVIAGIGDPRMKTLLEVGHFHTAGVSWREAYELLGDSIALVHIKDQVGGRSVPFGTGEIDLTGLFAHMRSVGYTGDYVIEMEVEDRENTIPYLAAALAYVAPRI